VVSGLRGSTSLLLPIFAGFDDFTSEVFTTAGVGIVVKN